MSQPPSYDETAAYPPPVVQPSAVHPPAAQPLAAYPPPTDYAPKPMPYPPPQNVPQPTEYTPQPPRPPPQPARQPPKQQGASTVVITQRVNSGIPSMSRTPVLFNCPFCGTQQVSRISYQYGSAFWIMFLVFFCLLGIFAFILLCFDEMKDIHHTCPNCNNTVGVHKAEC